MKKGFTLVELLATIVVIAIVSLIIFPLVSRHIGGTREDLYQVQVENIIKAAKAKALEDEEILKNAKHTAVYVSIEELQTSSASGGKAYLEAETIKNPIDDTEMKGSVEISYNEETNSYTYRYLTEAELEELNISTSKQAGEYIIDNQADIYTNESDKSGLFEDAETNTYYFKGSTPNNYLKISNTNWTIISINKKTKEIKLAKIRANTDADKSDSIWSLGTGKSNYKLTDTNLDMYKYLNESFYGNLPENLKKYIKKATWNIGEVSNETKTLSQARKEEASTTIESYVGLLTVSDYAYATNVLSCRKNYSDNNTCATNNYLAVNEGYFLMNPVIGDDNEVEENIWIASKDGLSKSAVTSKKLVYQTIILKDSAKISSGSGTSENPYILELN